MPVGAALATDHLLLRAIRNEPVPRVPVWLMRQAGRSDPEYRAYRDRAGLGLHELFRSPEHAIALSLLPQRFGVDAIIMYQDILTPLEPLGADFQFAPGPVLAEPVRHAADIARLRPYDVAAGLPYIAEEIRGLKRALGGALPLLGFAGAPFTLAAFMIEGASPGIGAATGPGAMAHTLAFAAEQPRAFEGLLGLLTTLAVDYLNLQIACGVDAVQVFESVGDQIPRPLYERYAQPAQQRIFGSLQGGVPGILFVRGSPNLDLMQASGAAVLSVAQGVSLRGLLRAGATADGGQRWTVQGNVDNRILATGSPAQVRDAVRRCLADSGGRGHILNLSHGLLPETPFENVLAFIEAAKEWRVNG